MRKGTPVDAAKVEPALYTIPQVCEILCIGRSTAYALISRGDLDSPAQRCAESPKYHPDAGA
jgi:predicted DNA-binding transcriptional regulator AlpA